MVSLSACALIALVAAPAACSLPSPVDSAAAGGELTGVTSAERGIHFQSYVYVPIDASDDAIKTAIARQVKTGIGALRTPKVSLDDRAAQSNLDPSTWTRRSMTVVQGATTRPVQRISFKYDDRAVVTNALAARSAVDFVMLADDYAQHVDPLKTDCSDDATTDTDSLWYHYYPQGASCRARVQAELDAIAAETSALSSGSSDGGGGNASDRIGPAEAGRWFMPVTAKLDPPKLPAENYSPEYDRLYGIGTDKSELVVYAFFGVDTDENNPDDLLAQEAMKFLRTMLAAQPSFRPTRTDPYALLLDVYVDGKKIDGVTYERIFQWIVDKSGYPSEVGTDAAKIDALRRQALSKFVERWIYWELPVNVSGSGASKDVTIQVRSFYGYEDGSAEARQRAEWRYLEAFWYGDVFLYNGHSHFGHGPLEPTSYGPQNFNDRYQIMLVNSCISYNYYHEDFLRMKPGGSKNLDMVVNGLPSYVLDGGVATARLLTGLIDGQQHSYLDLLSSMKLDFPWGETGYDPMRVVDGELDNVFSQTKSPLATGPQTVPSMHAVGPPSVADCPQRPPAAEAATQLLVAASQPRAEGHGPHMVPESGLGLGDEPEPLQALTAAATNRTATCMSERPILRLKAMTTCPPGPVAPAASENRDALPA